jgi:Kef-type K+ transport system membrane component KefB
MAHLLLASDTGTALFLTRLGGPLALGFVLGIFTSIAAQRLELATEFKLLLLGSLSLLLWGCNLLEIDILLTALVFGTTMANSCPQWNRLLRAIKHVDYPLYVCFFVLAGASLHLETLWHIGGLGVAYLLARSGGKLLGARLGARLGRFGPRERELVGMMMLSQAGLAIGLAAQLRRQWPAGGPMVETVVVGSVVIFELLGPLLVRQGLVRAGEVPLLSLLHKRAPKAAREGLHEVVLHFRQALGLPAGHRVADPGDILVKHVLRQNVDTVDVSTPYSKLLQVIAHSRYDRFPVVDRNRRFIGMINYTEIRCCLNHHSADWWLLATWSVMATCILHRTRPCAKP